MQVIPLPLDRFMLKEKNIVIERTGCGQPVACVMCSIPVNIGQTIAMMTYVLFKNPQSAREKPWAPRIVRGLQLRGTGLRVIVQRASIYTAVNIDDVGDGIDISPTVADLLNQVIGTMS